MKKIIKNSFIAIPVFTFLLVLSGFKSPDGGEGFEIYVENRLVLQQFGKDVNTTKTLQLNRSDYNSRLIVKYYHCGQVGKSRVITLKNGQNRILKEWRFPDTGTTGIACNIKDIVDSKTGNTELHLFYSSKELPAGRELVSIKTSGPVTTTP